jgi:putative peptide zinc metalloprotease protein
VLAVPDVQVIPGEQRQLPSPALGWRGGGEVPVEMDDERGSKTAEPYFKVIARLPTDAGLQLFDGVSGRMRFDLGSEPLLTGWTRRLWQLLQKRYQM